MGFALLQAWPAARSIIEPQLVTVSLVQPPPPPPAPPAPKPSRRPSPARRAAARPAERPAAPRRAPIPAAAPRRVVRPAPQPDPDALPASQLQTVELSEAQLAGAITAGSGEGAGGAGAGGGGGTSCDMVRRLQNALRRDPRVQIAVAEASRAPGSRGGAIMLWDGDWIQSPGEDGKGLASVRQAIMVEVGFAPEACRARPVHGLVLLSLTDGPGSARVVLGSRAWRWSDLLYAR